MLGAASALTVSTAVLEQPHPLQQSDVSLALAFRAVHLTLSTHFRAAHLTFPTVFATVPLQQSQLLHSQDTAVTTTVSWQQVVVCAQQLLLTACFTRLFVLCTAFLTVQAAPRTTLLALQTVPLTARSAGPSQQDCPKLILTNDKTNKIATTFFITKISTQEANLQQFQKWMANPLSIPRF